MQAAQVVSTGIPVLDHLLGGGIPRRQVVIVTGEPGAGKTILCSQIAFGQAARGANVVIGTITSEPHDKLVEELKGFSFFDQSRVGNELFLLSAYPFLVKGPSEAKEVLLKTVRERKAKLLFVDGLRSLRDLWQDESVIRKFLYDLNIGLAQSDCIGLFTTEYDLQTLLGYPEATTVDGIVALSVKSLDERRIRRLQVVKLRGRPHTEGQHVAHITHDGLRIVPRLESLVPAHPRYELRAGKVPFGLPVLDKLLYGGLPLHSTTLMAGSTGIGKTLLALHFAAAAREDSPALFVSFSEPAAKLIDRARAVKLDLTLLVAAKRLTLLHRAAIEVEADDLAREILDEVDALGAKRLIVDGIGELLAALTVPARARRFASALIESLRMRGLTTIFVKEVPKIAGTDLDFSDTPEAVIAENLLFLRHLELRGRLHRIISILKLRDGPADEHLREFTIGEEGIRVLEPMQSAEGVLTGLGRSLQAAPSEGAGS